MIWERAFRLGMSHFLKDLISVYTPLKPGIQGVFIPDYLEVRLQDKIISYPSYRTEVEIYWMLKIIWLEFPHVSAFDFPLIYTDTPKPGLGFTLSCIEGWKRDLKPPRELFYNSN
jgi:hypothetical protein